MQTAPFTRTTDAHGMLKFGPSDGFQQDVRGRVDAYFRGKGLSQRDSPRMYAKTAIVLGLFAAAYVLLVFFAGSAWTAGALSIAIGLLIVQIGVNVQHDGGHGAFSDRRWLNRAAACTLDMVGGSSYFWNVKHATLHHTYVNVSGYDDDIDFSPLARFAPSQPLHGFHRWQHLYMFFLYGLMAVKWHLVDDYRTLLSGRIGSARIPRPRGADLATLFAGKAIAYTLAFVIPLTRHGLGHVLACYATAMFVTGVALSLIFQLAHCVEEADFRAPDPATNRIENAWAVHQVESTVDFARGSRVVSWLLGGLNFQIEHHLFPRVSHVHYPALSQIVEAACRDHGVRFSAHATVRDGLASHYRWLRRMGRPADELVAA